MIFPIYLAITAQEFTHFEDFPSTLCYMACHFSPSGAGLSNLPLSMPPESILCIDDSTPIADHDTKTVADQICTLVERYQPCGIVLDFQRPDNPRALDMIMSIIRCTNCPVAVSHIYAAEFECPVLLPPLPFRLTVEEYLEPWTNREIWLELGNDMEKTIITEDAFGAERIYNVPVSRPILEDPILLCHYSINVKQDHIALYFHRTKEDLEQIQRKASALGVNKFLGLWQQLRQFYS